MTAPLDDMDRRILAELQSDGACTAEALGKAVNLSASQAARRRARLEREGFIRGTTIRVDPHRIGLDVQAFVQIQMASHAPEGARKLLSLLEREPRVVSVWTLTGEADYLLRVWCRDLAALNDLVHNTLLPHHAVARVQSQIVMDQPKRDASLPV